jgi:diketogulonate reductase-like aldo/keto reductase
MPESYLNRVFADKWAVLSPPRVSRALTGRYNRYMDILSKKLLNGFSLPVLGLGTWRMGGDTERDPTNDDARDVAAIRRAIDAGMAHIDTAAMYANGHAEELVAQAIDGMDRGKLFIATKVWPSHLRRADVASSLEASLRRLRIDHVDLLYIHHPNPDVPIEETIGAMDDLVDQGKARHIAVSNFTVARMEAAVACARHPIVANQVHYSLVVREAERKDIVRYCREHDMLFVAFRPIRDVPDCPLLDEMCDKYGKTPVQVAINWVISQPNIVALTKTSDATHLRESLGAVGWTMERDDIERLRREFPGQLDVSDRVPLLAD